MCPFCVNYELVLYAVCIPFQFGNQYICAKQLFISVILRNGYICPAPMFSGILQRVSRHTVAASKQAVRQIYLAFTTAENKKQQVGSFPPGDILLYHLSERLCKEQLEVRVVHLLFFGSVTRTVRCDLLFCAFFHIPLNPAYKEPFWHE